MLQNQVWQHGFWTITPLFVGLAALGIILFLVVLALKGYSLWTAAKRGEKAWFIVLLIINTAGILELIYLIAVAKTWPWKKDDNQNHDASKDGETNKSTISNN
jgi:H+/Cl- antiporter ClcA